MHEKINSLREKKRDKINKKKKTLCNENVGDKKPINS